MTKALALTLLLAACGGSTAPAPDLAVGTDSGTRAEADGGPVDGGSEDAAHTSSDLATAHDAATSPDAALHFPTDLGVAAKACEQCLNTSCSSEVAACDADPACVATLQCAVENACFGADATTCVQTCITAQDLTPQQQVHVAEELAAISTCSSACKSTCGKPDAGA